MTYTTSCPTLLRSNRWLLIEIGFTYIAKAYGIKWPDMLNLPKLEISQRRRARRVLIHCLCTVMDREHVADVFGITLPEVHSELYRFMAEEEREVLDMNMVMHLRGILENERQKTLK